MYLEQQDPERAWILDIEADGLEPTQVWCVCVENLKTDESLTFTGKKEFNDWLQESKKIFIGHNILSFDIRVLNRLWDSGISIDDCVDSLILSYLYNPGMQGGHSLGAYGERLRFPKADFNDWSKLTDEMVSYCQNDVRLTKRLYIALTQKMRKLKFSELSCRIEHEIRDVINDQELHGFWFDRAGAESLLHQLRERQSSITKEIQALFPPVVEEVARFKYRCKKDGSPSASYERHRQKYLRVEIVKDEYVCYDYVEFNLGSPKQRVTKLLSLGWVPQKFTKTKTDEFPQGFPQVNEDSLVAFSEQSGRKEIAALAEWLVLQGRSSMIDTWLNNVKPDSRIHGRVLSCGAATRRMVHFLPNTANIPSGAKAKYGHECRALWGVQPNRGLVLVGYDAAGLETAGLCHYLNNPTATEILLRPKPNDIHTANSRRLTEALGRPVDREWGAKTSWYAWLYGAYPPKLGEIVRGSPKDGDIVIDTFYRNVPGLKKLIEEVQNEFQYREGLLETIDGGFVRCPSLNAALNYKIQSAGAIVMKLTSIILRREAKKAGIRFHRVGDIHDEGQLETDEQNGHALGRLACDSITAAGRELGFRVLLGGDYKLGKTWNETH